VEFEHPSHPGRRVVLGYCLNVLAGEDLPSLERALEQVCAAVRERVAPDGVLGLGLYLPAALAMPLAEDRAARRRKDLAKRMRRLGLCAFTANAFPFGGFHRPGLKAGVFRPGWDEKERVFYTAAVALIADELAPEGASHVSVSTHSGLHRGEPGALDRVEACGRGLGLALVALDALRARHGRPTVLSIEPEPRSLAGDTRELTAIWPTLVNGARAELTERGVADPESVIATHLGLCLDTCHAAVEFEEPHELCARIDALGLPIGKVQVSSALRLPDPGNDAVGRARLLAMDEPVYLHQVTGRRGSELLRAQDLGDPALASDPAWLGCDEWRCHFHVPVDAPDPLPDAGGLTTTAAQGAATLAAVLADPTRWGTRDLHVEVETYTFDVLPPAWREGGLAASLARELEWTRARLADAGWRPAASGA
jgi:hypothetical protein